MKALLAPTADTGAPSEACERTGARARRARTPPFAPTRRRARRWPWLASVVVHGGVVVAGLVAMRPDETRPPVLEVASLPATWSPEPVVDPDAAEPDPVVEEPIAQDAEPIEVVEPPPAPEALPPEEQEAQEVIAAIPDTAPRVVARDEPPPPLGAPRMDASVPRARPVAIAVPPPASAPTPPPPPTATTAAATRAPLRAARSGVVTRARPFATNQPPAYPPEAARLGIVGTVTLLLDIDERGFVRAVTVSPSSGNEILDDAAVRAARAWRFEPARGEDGAAVGVVIRQRVGFASPD